MADPPLRYPVEANAQLGTLDRGAPKFHLRFKQPWGGETSCGPSVLALQTAEDLASEDFGRVTGPLLRGSAIR